MQAKIIDKKNIRHLIKTVGVKYKFFGPVKQDGNVVFKDVSQSGDITFDYINSKTNPKELFLPQSEILFDFRKDKVIPKPQALEKFVVFGIRPCDVQGILMVDKVYLTEDLKDVHYLARRENGIIVTLACNSPCETCFCAGVGGGPAKEDGSDVMVYESGETIIMKPITKKGENFINDCGKVLKGTGKSDLDKANRQAKDAAGKIGTEINLESVKKSLDKNFSNEFWEDIHNKCIGCGICTYLCPTCYCFDITDEMRGTEGERLRSWDSCMFRLFTLHASGHNPRPSGKERFRQRVMHKFKYLVDNCQVVGCTGCGRCVRECPVNLDVREVVNEIAKL
jgi:ferredoxin